MATPATKKLLLIFLFTISCGAISYAQSIIKGKITDDKTGEPLTGATVQIEKENIKLFAPVNLDGSYIFRNVSVGNYDLKVRFVGYKTTKEYTVEAKNGVITVLNVAMVENLNSLNEVNITEHTNKESDKTVRGIEKNANMIENILSANTIQLLPDVTVANALQRMSGVTIQRTNSGEGRYAIIRGMEQRYNNTLVNGIKIPSPDDKYRFIPMDIFPSELIERLEVIKALTPSMEGDAIGGTMNLVMKSAPDRFLLNANISGGYSTLFAGRSFSAFDHSGINKSSPAEINGNNYVAPYSDFTKSNLNYHNIGTPVNSTYGLTIGDRFLNKKLGVILSASYQNFYRGSNEGFLQPNAQPTVYTNPLQVNVPTFGDYYVRQYSTQTSTLGVHNKIDYAIDKNNKISLYNLYLHQDEYQTRASVDTTSGPNSTSTTKALVLSNRSTWTEQNVYNGTLHGDHTITNQFKINWNAVYSIAKKLIPDQAEYSLDDAASINNQGVITNSVIKAKSMTHRWEHNSDRDYAAYLNFIYTPKILDRNVEFSFGGLYRRKTRDEYYNSYSLIPIVANANTVFTDINTFPFGFASTADATGNVTTLNALNYTTHENTIAEYLQAKFDLTPKLQILGGVRIENTVQDYTTNTAIIYQARSGYINYTDVLPSVHAKYALTDQQNLRASYFRSISRPGYGEVVPYQLPGEYYDEIGNPNLLHTTADNYDFRYELFPGGADQVLLGTFYKKLYNPIEYSIVRDYNKPGTQYLQPVNGNQATNYGFEAQVTKYIRQFGVSANYTYTHSQIVQSKSFINYNQTTNQTENITVDQTRPLQGQAANVGNVSFLYKNPKIGLDIQIALVYTGERISQVSGYYNQDYWQRPYTQLDFSFEKVIVKHFSVYGKVNNITNATSKIFLKYPKADILAHGITLTGQDSNNDVLLQQDVYKMSLLGGLRYKF